MPGNIISNNADLIDQNTVKWDIDINDLSQQDYKLHAQSRIIHTNRIIVLLLIIVLMSFGLMLKLKKKK